MMSIETVAQSAPPPPPFELEGSGEIGRRLMEGRLQAALGRERLLLQQRDEMVAHQDLLTRESEHRMLNDLQMIVSLLQLQSRRSSNAEASAQLVSAANRVATIERVHRRLHCLDGVNSVSFRPYLEEFCRDISAMLFSEDQPERSVSVDCVDVELPTRTAIPLGFIVNELITNAAKYGAGPIMVSLSTAPNNRFALSVCDSGPGLPAGFDPAAAKGLGMRIVRSFADRIGAELQIGHPDNGPGACFTVFFG